jgi:uncharacterized membrane protein YfcA
VVQAFEGKGTLAQVRRFGPLIAAVAIGIFTGTALLTRLDQKVLLLVVGAFSIATSLTVVFKPNLAIAPSAERWLAVPVGLAAGVIGGMSTLFGPILTVYIIGLKLERDDFVKAISLVYTAAAGCLLVGGVSQGAAGPLVLVASTICMIPVYVGMLIGRRVRDHLDAALFYRLVLAVVFLGGANMVRQGLGF